MRYSEMRPVGGRQILGGIMRSSLYIFTSASMTSFVTMISVMYSQDWVYNLLIAATCLLVLICAIFMYFGLIKAVAVSYLVFCTLGVLCHIYVNGGYFSDMDMIGFLLYFVLLTTVVPLAFVLLWSRIGPVPAGPSRNQNSRVPELREGGGQGGHGAKDANDRPDLNVDMRHRD